MSRKTTAALIAALGINFAMAGGAIMLANLNKPTEFDIEAAFASGPEDLTTVADVEVDHEAGDLAIPLKAAQLGGNTRIAFSCGKQTPSGREVHEGTWDQISGAVLYRPDSQELIAVEAVFDTRSLRTDTQALTNTVTTKEKWFDIDNHPTASFVADKVDALNAATSSHTHGLSGSFTLNGITKPITIPVKLIFSGQSLEIESTFTILRSDFGVGKRESSIAGSVGGVASTVDDEVELNVRVTASPDPSAVVAELAKEVERQSETIASVRLELKQVKGSLGYFKDQTALLEGKIEELGYAVVREVDLSQIPDFYQDSLPSDLGPVPFSMVLVQGDEDAGVKPFYMAAHEVTWAMMTDWLYSNELNAVDAAAEIEAGLRPTPLWGTLSEQFQVSDKDHPAMGMTRLTAEAFCKWLSKKTGRKYRLPTHQEWLHALELGGGIPGDLGPVAWHKHNAVISNETFVSITSPVGSKHPNQLGIHDMLGSVAEWVTKTGDVHYVVGGSINTPPDEIAEAWKAVEDLEVWSASYPNLPVSRYWYVDYYYSGIRLVCEPASVAANPPKAGE